MKIEEKKVLLNRCNFLKVIFKEWCNKEWWYTGIYDQQSGTYLSWYFVRANLADKFTFTIFDPQSKEPHQFSKFFWLDKHQAPNRLCLNYDKRGVKLAYNGRGNDQKGWHFQMKAGQLEADIEIEPTIPHFTKFDNQIVDNYGLLHFFHNRANGVVKIKEKEYRLNNALVYYDHCFGKVPSQTGWHWLAVQNEQTALASLVNYGPYAQKYTESYFTGAEQCPRPNEWIRMEQSVSFERENPNSWTAPWWVTSSDMELKVSLQMHHTGITQIPPIICLLPKFNKFTMNITHTEVFVKADGRIRVDGKWLKVANMFGVMEEHFGNW